MRACEHRTRLRIVRRAIIRLPKPTRGSVVEAKVGVGPVLRIPDSDQDSEIYHASKVFSLHALRQKKKDEGPTGKESSES